MRLRNKTAVITGSTAGIGRALAIRFAKEGARVLIHGREREAGQKLLRDLGPSHALHIEDLTTPGAGQRVIEAAVSEFGGLDILVNNAADTTRSDFRDTDREVFHRALTTNTLAPLELIQAAYESLKKSHGAVLNIGSINGYGGEPGLLAYSLSKAALLALSRNLGDSLAPDGIRVNHFVVGWVLTENEQRLQIADGALAGWEKDPPAGFVPTGRMTTPEEVASAALYWCSDESRSFSGNVIELEQYPPLGRNPSKRP